MSGLLLGDYMFAEHRTVNEMLEPIADPVADTMLDMNTDLQVMASNAVLLVGRCNDKLESLNVASRTSLERDACPQDACGSAPNPCRETNLPTSSGYCPRPSNPYQFLTCLLDMCVCVARTDVFMVGGPMLIHRRPCRGHKVRNGYESASNGK